MIKIQCKKCLHDKYYLKEVPNGTSVATGLYCEKCNSWQKWVGKAEINALKDNATHYDKVELKPLSPAADDLEVQIAQLKKTIAALEDLRNRLKEVKEKKQNNDPVEGNDDTPPWDD